MASRTCPTHDCVPYLCAAYFINVHLCHFSYGRLGLEGEWETREGASLNYRLEAGLSIGLSLQLFNLENDIGTAPLPWMFEFRACGNL